LPGNSVTSYAVDHPASLSQNAGPGATDMSSHISIAGEGPTYGSKAKEFCNAQDPVCDAAAPPAVAT